MSHIDDKVIELAHTALSFVYSGEHFYRHAAEMTRNASGKAMFLRLAEENADRMVDLHSLFSNLIGKEEWQRLVAEESVNTQSSKVTTEMEAEVERRGHSVVADDTQALRLAMEMERRLIHLLKELVSHTNDPEIIKLAGNMIEGECFQYDSFQAQLDSVLNTGLWLDSPEFRMDAKF
jgi:rubrerythrin